MDTRDGALPVGIDLFEKRIDATAKQTGHDE
jgi:hypothetical protein